MELLNKNILDKFYGLIFFLKKSRKDFELVADEIGDSPLRTALNGLSTESNYFAGEIKQQLKCLGMYAENAEGFQDYIPESYETESEIPGTEISTICSHNEFSLLRAYNDLITDSIPYQNLKEIMIFQMNALKNTFSKVQTLNTARFVSY
jgi:hypothetical protein